MIVALLTLKGTAVIYLNLNFDLLVKELLSRNIKKSRCTARNSFAIFISIALIGCQSKIPYDCHETCASRNQICVGESIGNDSVSGTIMTPDYQMIHGFGGRHSNSIQCAAPRTEQQWQQVENFKSSGLEKYKINEKIEQEENVISGVLLGLSAILVIVVLNLMSSV